MSRTRRTFDVGADQIWAVLADATTYEHWVVGCKRIRDADPHWPEPGAEFHHTVGVGPLDLDDSTEVLESDPERRLKLRARARPTGIAHVLFELEPAADGGTEVVMTELPVEGFGKVVHNPLQDRLIHRRNVETLKRLSALAGQRALPPA
jgi:uncharacterized protein YndB with AHSA1/START domain